MRLTSRDLVATAFTATATSIWTAHVTGVDPAGPSAAPQLSGTDGQVLQAQIDAECKARTAGAKG